MFSLTFTIFSFSSLLHIKKIQNILATKIYQININCIREVNGINRTTQPLLQLW